MNICLWPLRLYSHHVNMKKCGVWYYIRKSGQSLHLVNTARNQLRVSDVTLNSMDLRTKRQRGGLDQYTPEQTVSDKFRSVLGLVNYLVSSLAADFVSCLLENVQLPAHTNSKSAFSRHIQLYPDILGFGGKVRLSCVCIV